MEYRLYRIATISIYSMVAPESGIDEKVIWKNLHRFRPPQRRRLDDSPLALTIASALGTL